MAAAMAHGDGDGHGDGADGVPPVGMRHSAF